MGAYLTRRVLLMIPTVVGAVTLLFALFFVMPGDPAQLIAGGGDRAIPQVTRDQIKARYGLDQSIPEQYVSYWARVATGDLGESYKSRESVGAIIARTLPASARLAFWAVVIETVVGLSVGIYSAVRKYSFLDSFVTIGTAAMGAVPVFVLGYLLQQALGVFPAKQGWSLRLPVQGIGPNEWVFGVFPASVEQLRYLILPAVVLASVSTAVIARMMRATMLEIEKADFLRTARAKGLRNRTVVVRHGVRNALIPVVTLIGVDIGALIGSAILTETVFNWPGMGSKLADATSDRDLPVMLGLTLVVIVVYAVTSLIVDLSYSWFDPRVRLGEESA
ncbi:MAG: ABC transporter permease [Actinomycetes bacterium]